MRLSKAFSLFDEKPEAAASLGQVHRAALRDGRVVAVKVQRPNIVEQVARDLEALQEVAAFLDKHTDAGRRYNVTGIVDEFRESLASELDYRREAANLRLIGAQPPRVRQDRGARAGRRLHHRARPDDGLRARDEGDRAQPADAPRPRRSRARRNAGSARI